MSLPRPNKLRDLTNRQGQDRMLLEWCRSHESLLGRPCLESRRCGITRLIEAEDMTTESGFRYAQSAMESCSKDTFICIWSAIPVTGGSPWQNMNRLMPGGQDKSQTHFDLCLKLWGETRVTCKLD